MFVQEKKALATHNVILLVVLVLNDVDHVETRQDRGLKVNVLARGLEVVVSPENWVGRGEHGGSRVQNGGNASLGDRNGLLLHGLVNGNTVVLSHLVKLINAHHTTVSEHHGTSFKVKVPGGGITNHGGGETSGTAALAGGVDTNGRDLFHKLEHLTLGSSRISEQQHVNVTTKLHSVRQDLARPTQEQAGDRLLDVGEAKDRRSDAGSELFVDVGVLGELDHLGLLFLGEGGLAAAPRAQGVELHAHDAEIGLPQANATCLALLIAAAGAVEDGVHTHQGHPGTWHGDSSQVAGKKTTRGRRLANKNKENKENK